MRQGLALAPVGTSLGWRSQTLPRLAHVRRDRRQRPPPPAVSPGSIRTHPSPIGSDSDTDQDAHQYVFGEELPTERSWAGPGPDHQPIPSGKGPIGPAAMLLYGRRAFSDPSVPTTMTPDERISSPLGRAGLWAEALADGPHH